MQENTISHRSSLHAALIDVENVSNLATMPTYSGCQQLTEFLYKVNNDMRLS